MWVEATTRQQLERARKLAVNVGEHEVVLIWHDGAPYAMANICIHQGRELVDGVIFNGRLVCPGHQWAYELGTGYCKERDRCQPTFDVRLEGDNVLVATEPAALDLAAGE